MKSYQIHIIRMYVSLIAVFVLLPKLNAQTITDTITTGGTTVPSYFFYQRSEYPRDCDEVREQCLSSNSSGLYIIKPDGYVDPFEAYCDFTTDSGGWTVIQRRLDGWVDFNRGWESYKHGFGFLSHEFWLGNEKLSYLTNQKQYQLSFEITTSDGSTINVTYNNFRINDEFSDYNLISIGQYSGTNGITWCQGNMVYGNCTCQSTCADPETCTSLKNCNGGETCICPEGYFIDGSACIAKEQCGCFVTEAQTIIQEGHTYVNTGCTRRGVCSNGQISWNEGYRCSPNAACEERNNIRQCYCNEGYSGDGQTCTSTYKTDCKDWYNAGSVNSGIYSITPTGWTGSAFDVYCNMTDGGGWTVFQRRVDGATDFYLYWNDYKRGFGNLNSEFWLGNDKLYYLTNQRNYEIRIDLVNKLGAPYYAKFDRFRINNEADNYRLSVVGTYSGTADRQSSPDGIALTYHRNMQFSTRDRDNDERSDYHLADYRHSAWWYKAYGYSDLNADFSYNSGDYRFWAYLPVDSAYVKFSEMKVRPV